MLNSLELRSGTKRWGMGAEPIPLRADPPGLFCPDWGSHNRLLWEFVNAVDSGGLNPLIDEILSTPEQELQDLDATKVVFCASLLKDVLRAGGRIWTRDSRLWVSWPDWSGPHGRTLAQAAMTAVREIRPLTYSEIERVRPLFAPDLDGDQLTRILQEGRFCLVSAAESHPTGVQYSEAFSAALRYWTMPYRGRTGRNRRFVLTAAHSELGSFPRVIGILELGDEAPFCTWRDDILALNASSAGAWFSEDPVKRARAAADRLRGIRSSLLRTTTGTNLARSSSKAIIERREEIETASRGRSLILATEHVELKDRKRLIYGLRLARGEAYLNRVANRSVQFASGNPDFGAGVRALHDLVLPRVHMEATICGAVPPFAEALGGKLLVSFLTHPIILDAPLSTQSGLLSWSFNLARLDEFLPAGGMLCVTTKGLYSEHAAIYNRSSAPGKATAVQMQLLAKTEGTTTTLLSTNTARLARKVLERAHPERSRVSRVYGSGGAKRHRAIEAALRICGLPDRLAMAGIRRPVYGMTFASNAPNVVWTGSRPNWLVHRAMPPQDADRMAADHWRSRWLPRAVAKIRDYALAPSLLQALSEQGHAINE